MADKKNTIIARENLQKELFAIYKFGYSVEHGFNQFQQDFDKYIITRLGKVFNEAKYVIIEPSYVEAEWKDMISLHYINTTYAAQLLPRTIRIHFLISDKFCEDEYLGFITLRPIEEIQIALSYIFVNWNLLKKIIEEEYENCNCQFVGYRKQVHYNGHKLSIKTYPVLTQDTIVTCCADVNIITLSRFLAHEFGGKKLEIRDICKDNYNVVFPRQITADRFIQLCSNMHIPFKTRNVFSDPLLGSDTSESARPIFLNAQFRNRESVERYIDTYLDSNLPVVFFVSGHVIQIVGYKSTTIGKEYLILDDSGFKDPQAKNRFCYFVDIKEILTPIYYSDDTATPDRTDSAENTTACDCMDSTVDVANINLKNVSEDPDSDLKLMLKFHNFLQNNVITIGIPQSDRVYIDYNYYEVLLNNMIKHLWNPSSEQYKWFLDENGDFLAGVKTRSKLVEGTCFVKYLTENIESAWSFRNELMSEKKDTSGIDSVIANLNNAITKLESISLPHYLWYTELTNESGLLVGLCADPTRFYKDTTHLDKVFYNSLFDPDKRGIAIIQSMWDYS